MLSKIDGLFDGGFRETSGGKYVREELTEPSDPSRLTDDIDLTICFLPFVPLRLFPCVCSLPLSRRHGNPLRLNGSRLRDARTTKSPLQEETIMRRGFLTAAVTAYFLLAGAATNGAAPDNSPPVQTVLVVLPENAGLVLKNIAAVFARQMRQRCEAKVVMTGDAPLAVEFTIEPGIGTEGFRISDRVNGSIRITGNDNRGLLYGVGKFLRSSRYDRNGFTPGAWRGTSVPQKRVRGIYFGAFFQNFYNAAPLEEVQQYVEDIGLWGYNTVMVWNCLVHYDGFDDPKAVKFRQRLRAICQKARGIGLDVGFLVIGNEGYKTCPASVRADPGSMKWGPGAVCPSKPEGMKYILDVFAQMFDRCDDLRPDYVCIWSYDPGGCGCPECRPWGSNGLLKVGEPLASLARKKLPGAKIILATWDFDLCFPNEYKELTKKFAEQRPWPDYILTEDQRPWVDFIYADAGHPNIGGLPMIGFPEISMWELFPWGGYGATALPRHFQAQWNVVKARSSGGFPYSEGISEDINKVLFSQFYWNDRPAEETLREYAAFEYSPDVVDDVMRVITILEENHSAVGSLSDKPREMKPNNAEEAYETVKRVDAKLTPQGRKAWRWRQLYLRALLDAERTKNRGLPNDRCQEAFAELIEIYHAQNAEAPVRPPLDPNFRGKPLR
jgi:hypothetical protein